MYVVVPWNEMISCTHHFPSNTCLSATLKWREVSLTERKRRVISVLLCVTSVMSAILKNEFSEFKVDTHIVDTLVNCAHLAYFIYKGKHCLWNWTLWRILRSSTRPLVCGVEELS